MKKYLALLALLPMSAFADGFYGGMSGNRFEAEIVDEITVQGSSWGGEIGYQWKPNLAFEVRAAPPWIDTSASVGPLKVSVDGYSFSLVTIPRYFLTEQVSVYGVLGALIQTVDIQYSDIHFKERHRDLLWGGGLQYDHGTNYIRAEGTTNLEGNMWGLALGLGMRF